MENKDFEKFRTAWQSSSFQNESRLSEAAVLNYMRSGSKSILVMYRRGLVMDIFAKLLLSLYALILLVGKHNDHQLNILSAVLFGVGIAGSIYQGFIFRLVPGRDDAGQNIMEKLKLVISFYHRKYSFSVLVSGITAPLFVALGMITYYLVKYGGIPELQPEDFLVLSGFLLAAYMLAAIAGIIQHTFRIRQLEESLVELEQDTLTEGTIARQARRNLRRLIIAVIFIIAGLLALLMIIHQFGN